MYLPVANKDVERRERHYNWAKNGTTTFQLWSWNAQPYLDWKSLFSLFESSFQPQRGCSSDLCY